MININFSLTYIEVYLIFVNISAFIVFGYDKLQALNNKNISRVSEIKLLLLILLGGIIGGLIAMLFFRHKMKKLSFTIKVIIVILIQYFWYYFIVM
jgi:uncharacterized membrane protein YsdA (DUF1294 family)